MRLNQRLHNNPSCTPDAFSLPCPSAPARSMPLARPRSGDRRLASQLSACTALCLRCSPDACLAGRGVGGVRRYQKTPLVYGVAVVRPGKSPRPYSKLCVTQHRSPHFLLFLHRRARWVRAAEPWTRSLRFVSVVPKFAAVSTFLSKHHSGGKPPVGWHQLLTRVCSMLSTRQRASSKVTPVLRVALQPARQSQWMPLLRSPIDRLPATREKQRSVLCSKNIRHCAMFLTIAKAPDRCQPTASHIMFTSFGHRLDVISA